MGKSRRHRGADRSETNPPRQIATCQCAASVQLLKAPGGGWNTSRLPKYSHSHRPLSGNPLLGSCGSTSSFGSRPRMSRSGIPSSFSRGLVGAPHGCGLHATLIKLTWLAVVVVPPTPVAIVPIATVPVRRAPLEVKGLGCGDITVWRVRVIFNSGIRRSHF